jgi:hypothetical protein
VVPSFDASGNLLNGNAPSVPYGSLYIIRMYVTDNNGVASPTGPPSPTCAMENALTCPSGTVTLTDSGTAVGTGGGGAGIYNLNSQGYTRNLSPSLTGGTHTLLASYSGDGSYQASSSGPVSFTVTPAAMTISEQVLTNSPVAGIPFQVSVTGYSQALTGVASTGTVTFYDGATQLGSPVTISGNPGGTQPSFFANATFTVATAGSHTLSANYSGDANYAAASTSTTVNALNQTTASVAISPSTVNYGSSVSITGAINTTVSASNAALKPTGSVALYGIAEGQITTGVTTTVVADGSGNWQIQLAATLKPSSSESFSITYSGDSNYASAIAGSSFLTVILPDFSLTPNPSSLTITAGQTGSTVVTLAPLTSLASTVALTCSAPVMIGVTCSASPASVNLSNNNSVATTVTFTTIGASNSTAAAIHAKHAWLPWPLATRTLKLCLACIAIAALFLILLPGRRRYYRMALGAASASIMIWALGCGGGGGSGGGGGGGGGGIVTVPTSLAITTSATKVPQSNNPVITLTATVTSTKNVTGTVNFWENGNSGALSPPVTVTNGAATAQVALPMVGTHQIYAQYSGDSQNQASQSSTVNVVATGSAYISVQGVSGPVTRNSTIWVTIQ